MDPMQEQIDTFYKELFDDEDFQAYLRKLTDELIEKHIVRGEPFDAVCFDASWDETFDQWTDDDS